MNLFIFIFVATMCVSAKNTDCPTGKETCAEDCFDFPCPVSTTALTEEEICGQGEFNHVNHVILATVTKKESSECNNDRFSITVDGVIRTKGNANKIDVGTEAMLTVSRCTLATTCTLAENVQYVFFVEKFKTKGKEDDAVAEFTKQKTCFKWFARIFGPQDVNYIQAIVDESCPQ